MFTKLNRVLLASGLAIASAAMLSPAVFAQTNPVSRVLNGTIQEVYTLEWTGTSPIAFPISASGDASNVPLGSVAASGNVAFTVKASSPTGGNLTGTGESPLNTETISYNVSLVGGTQLAVPATGVGTVLFTGNATTPLVSSALTLNTTGHSPDNLSPQTYTDTLTLTTSAP